MASLIFYSFVVVCPDDEGVYGEGKVLNLRLVALLAPNLAKLSTFSPPPSQINHLIRRNLLNRFFP
ncbi:hypothetical protein ACFL9S_05510 [Erwinia sp. AnSW2-5]